MSLSSHSLYLIPLIIIKSIQCTTFTFINYCDAAIWPAILTNAGHPQLNPTGFQLQPTQTRSIPAPPGWSGRFWARTGCTSTPSNQFSCLTADCRTNQTECSGSGATPPATLAEFSLAGPASTKDFYDVSLVDGFNLPMMIRPGSSGCGSAGCSVDLTRKCPSKLSVKDNDACRSACDAFGKPEFCCTGEFGNVNTCRPTRYSQVFKAACPRAYSYAFDDATSLFTCGGGDYFITFCDDDSTARHKKKAPDTGNISYAPPETTAVAAGENGGMWGDNSWLSNLTSGEDASVFLNAQVSVLFLVYASIQIIFQIL